MDTKEGEYDWLRCMEENNFVKFRELVSRRGFQFEHYFHPDNTVIENHFPTIMYARTPIGYALILRKLWAFEALLEAGANPDVEHISLPDGSLHKTLRPIEWCVDQFEGIRYLLPLLQHGASTCFTQQSNGNPFIDRPRAYTDIIRAAHDRELRAYTTVWCALNAGGCWPDMAMLLQAMVMRDDLTVDVSHKRPRTQLE